MKRLHAIATAIHPALRRFLLATYVLALFASGLDAGTLEERLKPLIDAHEGQVAVSVKHLEKGETFAHRADEPMPTASLIKFPVMIETYRQAGAGLVDLAKQVTLREQDKVPGSGILTTHFSGGAAFPLRDAVRLMIAYSDNTATNLVLAEIGLPATAKYMEELGCPNTKIHSQVYKRETSVFPERSKQFGLGSTTATEMVRLLELLHQRKLVSPEASEKMREHLLKCDDTRKFPRFLPAGTKLAHKTGSLDASRTDAGIIESPAGPIALCVLTHENKDKRWTDENAGDLLCARIAQAVYEHFNPPAPAAGAKPGHAAQLLRGGEAFVEAAGDGSEDDEDPAARAIAPLAELKPRDALAGPPFVAARAWAVAEAQTGKLLWESQAADVVDTASTTKIMTAYVIIKLAAQERNILDEAVVFSERADKTAGSSCGVHAGEKLPVRELLYGLLVPSGNDAAVALAEAGFDSFPFHSQPCCPSNASVKTCFPAAETSMPDVKLGS